MRAVGFEVSGGPEVLVSVEVPVPVAGPGEVLVRVSYAGVNFADVQHRLGDFGSPDPLSVPGIEVSGRIAALGAGVTGLAVGDAVAAFLPEAGGYAEFAVAPARTTFPLRTAAGDVDLRTAAGAALVLPTAYGVLAGAARLREGDTVLVHAAAGGVGSVAAQIARELGAAAVYGTTSTAEKADYAKKFGYDAVFAREGFADAVLAATGGRGVDVILDPVGGPVRQESLDRVLAPFGRVAVYGENNRGVVGYNIGDLDRRDPDLLRRHTLAGLALLGSGAVQIDITEVLPLTEAPRAHERMQAGGNRGKTLLAVAEDAVS